MNNEKQEAGKALAYTVVKMAASEASPAFPGVKVNKSGGWVTFGDRNDFPQQIINASSKSPVNKSIILSTVTYICGKGVKDSRATATTYVGTPNPKEKWDDVIEKLATDYKTFAGFYWQVIKNKDGVTVSIFHQDFSTVRVGLINDKGEPLTWRISNDWKKTSGANKPIELDAWPGMEAAAQGKAYIFHHWDYEPGLLLYCVPNWYHAIEYVRADGQLGVFYNNSIENGFTPSVVISMPSNPEEPKKEAFQKQMEEAFSGAKGASSIVVLWGESDEVKPNITPFNASANADIYNNIEAIIFQKIISAHRLSSPTLAGVSGSGNLSGNAAEIIDAYILYNYTVVEKMRRKILDKLNEFQRINKVADLVIQELDVLPKIRETEDPAAVIDTITPNAEEIEALATKIGVGGTQALTAIISDPAMDEGTKRGLLKTLFGLSDEEIDSLFGGPKRATLQRKTSFKDKIKKLLKWN